MWAGETDIGRNLHGVARSYVTGQTGSISVSPGAGNRYVVAIPSSEDLQEFGILSSGISLRNNVGNSDLPLPPSYPGAYIDAVLDYYLKYEKYKNDWNTKAAGLTVDLYEAAWDTYEDEVHGYKSYGLKIPPYVGFSSSGASVVFSNMAPGRYRFYYISYDPSIASNYGKLFLNGEFNDLFGGVEQEITRD